MRRDPPLLIGVIGLAACVIGFIFAPRDALVERLG
jgi:hypothetical protein